MHSDRRMKLKLILALSLLATACVDEAADDPIDESFFDDESKADAFGIQDGTPDALGVLKLANQATRSTLQSVGLTKQAIDQMLLRRDGADKASGTVDDNLFDTLRELDDVPYIGAGSFSRLLTFARANGYVTATPPPPPPTANPFDPASCAGPTMTMMRVQEVTANGQRAFPTGTTWSRTRQWNGALGFGPWSQPTKLGTADSTTLTYTPTANNVQFTSLFDRTEAVQTANGTSNARTQYRWKFWLQPNTTPSTGISDHRYTRIVDGSIKDDRGFNGLDLQLNDKCTRVYGKLQARNVGELEQEIVSITRY